MVSAHQSGSMVCVATRTVAKPDANVTRIMETNIFGKMFSVYGGSSGVTVPTIIKMPASRIKMLECRWNRTTSPTTTPTTSSVIIAGSCSFNSFPIKRLRPYECTSHLALYTGSSVYLRFMKCNLKKMPWLLRKTTNILTTHNWWCLSVVARN